METSRTSRKKHTWAEALFLLLAFPLGLFYFILVVVGLSVGASTLILWIGIPILFLTFLAVRAIVHIEIAMVESLLHVYIPRKPRSRAPRTLQQYCRALFKDPLTWKGILYIVCVKYPLGTVFFCITLTLLCIVASFVLMPLGYLICTSIYNALGLHDPWGMLQIQEKAFSWSFIVINGQFQAIDFIKSFAVTAIGLVLWFPTRYVIKGMAYATGVSAKALLGASEREMAMPKDTSYVAREPQEDRPYHYQARERDYWAQTHSNREEDRTIDGPPPEYPAQEQQQMR